MMTRFAGRFVQKMLHTILVKYFTDVWNVCVEHCAWCLHIPFGFRMTGKIRWNRRFFTIPETLIEIKWTPLFIIIHYRPCTMHSNHMGSIAIDPLDTTTIKLNGKYGILDRIRWNISSFVLTNYGILKEFNDQRSIYLLGIASFHSTTK